MPIFHPASQNVTLALISDAGVLPYGSLAPPLLEREWLLFFFYMHHG